MNRTLYISKHTGVFTGAERKHSKQKYIHLTAPILLHFCFEADINIWQFFVSFF